MSFLNNVYVIHVKQGYEERKKHIDSHLPSRGIYDFKYMLDGDIEDIAESIYAKHFFSELSLAHASCFYKHFLVYKDMVEKNIETALVFEDDAILINSTLSLLEKLEKELHSKRNFLVNIEKTVHFVPTKIKKKNHLIYPANCTKLTGGYVIHLDVAKKIYRYCSDNKTELPIDTFQSRMRHKLTYNIFWMEPSIVQQGSKNGQFSSVLSNRSSNKLGRISSFLNKLYHQHIRSNFSKKRQETFENVKLYDK